MSTPSTHILKIWVSEAEIWGKQKYATVHFWFDILYCSLLYVRPKLHLPHHLCSTQFKLNKLCTAPTIIVKPSDYHSQPQLTFSIIFHSPKDSHTTARCLTLRPKPLIFFPNLGAPIQDFQRLPSCSIQSQPPNPLHNISQFHPSSVRITFNSKVSLPTSSN